MPEEWTPAQRARLQDSVTHAIERAVATLQRPGLRIEIVAAPVAEPLDVVERPRGSPHERREARGGRGDGDRPQRAI
jgi:hypothetical protein